MHGGEDSSGMTPKPIIRIRISSVDSSCYILCPTTMTEETKINQSDPLFRNRNRRRRRRVS